MIDHLSTPILVFDHKQRLTYTNGAFAQLFEGME
ncbi:PAS domain-containing protein [Cellvibrio mixtus]